jgi:hypothetical protein
MVNGGTRFFDLLFPFGFEDLLHYWGGGGAVVNPQGTKRFVLAFAAALTSAS